MELQPIVHVWINHDSDLVDLTITTTTHAPQSTVIKRKGEVIHTNQKHGFLPVKQITLGMHLIEADGHVGVVTGWKVVPGTKVMYNLEVAQDHTFTVGDGQWVVHNCGGDWKAVWNKLSNGMKMNTNDALDAAHAFLEKGYSDISNGRFVSADGLRQVRMGVSDILGCHGGGPHMNFELLEPNPLKPGKLWIPPKNNIPIFLDDTLPSIISSILP